MNQQLMHFKSAFIREDEMWCVSTLVNWLLKINLNDWSIKCVCNLGLDVKFQIDYIFQYGDYVWCITAVGVRLVRYHMLTGEIGYFSLFEEDRRRNRGTVLFDDKLWIIPIELPGKMISFDLIRNEFAIHDSWERECRKWKVIGKAVSFYQIENLIYMPLLDECKVIQFDLKKEKIEIIQLPGEKSIRCVFVCGGSFYYVSFAKKILFRWDEKKEEIKKIYCPYLQSRPYRNAIEFGDNILLVNNETVDIFESKTETISPYDEVQRMVQNDYSAAFPDPLFFGVITYDARHFLIPWTSDVLLEFHEKQKKWISHKIEIPKYLYFKEYVIKTMSISHKNFERDFLIEGFLYFVVNVHIKRRKQGQKKQIGYEIYKKIRNS